MLCSIIIQNGSRFFPQNIQMRCELHREKIIGFWFHHQTNKYILTMWLLTRYNIIQNSTRHFPVFSNQTHTHTHMWQILSSFLRCIVYNRGKTEAIYQIQRLWKLMPICDTSHVSFCQNCECIFVYSVVYIVVLRTIIYDKAIIWFCVMIECLCLRLFTVKCGFLGILTSTTTEGHLPPPFPPSS